MLNRLPSSQSFLVMALLLGGVTAAPAEDRFGSPVDREFTSQLDGTPQQYVELSPRDLPVDQLSDVLIALHGHGADRWQYIRETRGECRGVRDVAERHGMRFISPDYRARTSWMGPAAEADLIQLIQLLRARYRVRNVYLAGGSMGGTSALIFAALQPSLIDGVLSENGTANMVEYAQFQDAIAASYGGAKQDRLDEYRKRSPELTPERFTMPVAFTVGGQDTVVPPDSVRRLAKKLLDTGRPDVLLLDDQAGGHATNYDETVRAMEFVVAAVNSRRSRAGESP